MKINKIIFTLILILSFIILGNTYVNAAEASISATSPEVGGSVSVTVTVPSDVIGWQGTVKVTFKDGSTKTMDIIPSVEGVDKDFSRSKTFTFNANVEGEGKAEATGLILSDSNGNKCNANSTVTASFTVKAKPTTPAQPTTPTQPSEPAKPAEPTQPTTPPPADNKQPVMNDVSTGDTNLVGSTNEVKNEVEKKPEPIKVTMKEEVNKTMYVDVSSCNVRNADSKKAEIIGGLKRGAKVEVTGITTNGWYRIKYYKDVAYVADVLSDEEPEKVENEVSNEVKNEVENEVSNLVDNEIENVVDDNTNELEELKNTIGVIPEVGNNIFDVLFVVVSVLGLGYAFYVSYKNREEV